MQKNLALILDYLHCLIILTGLCLGFFLSFHLVCLLVLIHRIHVLIFDGCLFSKIQKKIGHLKDDLNFLQHLAQRLFKKHISRRAADILDYSLVLASILIAAAVHKII